MDNHNYYNDIPQISTRLPPSPTAFPNCCLSLSTTLITHLSSLLPPAPNHTLSIGSGSGLLEALITHRHPNVSIQGVEVNSSVNLYLAEQSMNVVGGTWDLYSRAGQARAWMFVYPRDPRLVRRYFERYGNGVQAVLWLGPRADWEDYEGCFRGEFGELEFCESVDVGLAEFEMLVVGRSFQY
ncbi:hypothetical protein BDW59DRAFT_147881 [Aspergillus cavernicola]|uniref:S-adenosyl-L-methionine-dependent methyltransferase n=1 Tax=Aspergillus cavernicola TaxID=176166 RepID=A0ABR4I8Z3_9EURO